MPVENRPRPAPRAKDRSPTSVAEDVAEFASLLSTTLRDLKSAGPPPAGIRDAIERPPLRKRHMPALLAVAAAGPISVSDLARRLGLLLSSTSTIVGQLSRAGLLERAEDEEDRRRTIVRLHEDYRVPMETWLDTAIAPVRSALEQLSPQARAHFMEGWRILQREAALRSSAEGSEDCPPEP
jgi:DNA-binding MarR family transcriptional regulator